MSRGAPPASTPSPHLDLDALAARLPARPLTRFAPSPTGHLHLGHVVNAIYVWGAAAALGGRVLLRIEDHDRERSRPEYEASILEDLAWLGLEPDAAPALVRQRECAGSYAAALDQLDGLGLVYACRCSRREIADASQPAVGRAERTEERPVEEPLETPYRNTCRERGLDRRPGCGLRVRMDPGVESFDDAALGAQEQEPSAQCGDLLVRDRHGQWTYQFAVTVDDLRQGVDFVIRGSDLLASTGRQIRLARVLGRTEPAVFLHHRLLIGPAGRKLSKSEGDTGIRELRARGLSPADVLGLAAAACGLVSSPRRVRPADLRGVVAPPRTVA